MRGCVELDFPDPLYPLLTGCENNILNDMCCIAEQL